MHVINKTLKLRPALVAVIVSTAPLDEPLLIELWEMGPELQVLLHLGCRVWQGCPRTLR